MVHTLMPTDHCLSLQPKHTNKLLDSYYHVGMRRQAVVQFALRGLVDISVWPAAPLDT